MSKTATKLMPLASLDPSKVQVGRPLLSDLSAWLSVDFPNVTLGLAGGCVRDQLHGRHPKDIDLVVVGAHEAQVLAIINNCTTFFDSVRGSSHELIKLYDRDDKNDYTDKFPGDEDRFHAIAQYAPMHEGGLPVDVLIYADRIRTLADVTDSHDYSINQFVAWLDHRGAFHAEYFGSVPSWGTCVQLRPHLTEDRIKRVKQICAELGWTYEEDF
jgi:hypothetical protein